MIRIGTGRNRRADIDMTQGSIVGRLLTFAAPLLLGNLFQQLYNMVDTWVIGQTGVDAAYAAVGSVAPIINILIGFFLGLSSGAGVIISQYYGAKDEKGVRAAVHVSMALTILLAAVFTVLGMLSTPLMLRMMLHGADQSEVYPYARSYLLIYFAGVSGLMIYNMGSGILRAIGDSRHPFYFLLASAASNVALDLLFVFVLQMGVAGVALATVLAQLLSALLTLFVLLRTDSCVRLRPKEMHLERAMLRRIAWIGFPAALQMALTAFSNVFVQSYISGVDVSRYVETDNPGTAALGGWTTYSKLDQLIFLPIQSLSLATTTFVGQNLGCGNTARARRGTRTAWAMASAVTLLVMFPLLRFAAPLASVFNSSPDILGVAVVLIRRITPFYLFSCVNQVYSAALRGAGQSRAPMFIMLSSFVGFRQLYLFVMTRFISNDLVAVAFGYPAGWGCCCIITLLYYFTHRNRLKKIID